jgi:hypothetical protein
MNLAGNVLREMADRCERAAAAIRKHGGRGRAWAGSSAPPKVCCAMIISKAWRLVHGAPPAPGNTQAGRAARAYWRASGGTESGAWGTDRLRNWRTHFGAIAHYPADIEHVGQLLINWRWKGDWSIVDRDPS